MKANSKRQIESIISQNWLFIFKLFFCIVLMKNPLIYIPLYPRQKTHNSLFSFYMAKINLACYGFQILKVFYIDFFKAISGDFIGAFISIKWNGIYRKRHIFINRKRFFALATFHSTKLLKHNQNGFISWQFVEDIYKWLYRLIICLFLAFAFSIKDIDIPSYQEILNDMVYITNIIEKVFY
jgi:hypothetical protein